MSLLVAQSSMLQVEQNRISHLWDEPLVSVRAPDAAAMYSLCSLRSELELVLSVFVLSVTDILITLRVLFHSMLYRSGESVAGCGRGEGVAKFDSPSCPIIPVVLSSILTVQHFVEQPTLCSSTRLSSIDCLLLLLSLLSLLSVWYAFCTPQLRARAHEQCPLDSCVSRAFHSMCCTMIQCAL